MAKRKCDYSHPSVYVATPAYDGKVDTDYARSLAESAQACTVFGIYFNACVMANGAFIELARNMFVRLFLEENPECTHLFFIDADLGFTSAAFVNCVTKCTEEHPVISGAYRRREKKENYPYMWQPEPDEEEDRLWVKDEHFLQCSRVAAGFLCIRRNVIEEMVKDCGKITIHNHDPIPNLFRTHIDKEGRFVGEDFTWSDDYTKKYDRPLEVLPDFDFVHGGYKGNFAKYLTEQIKSEADEKKRPKRKLGDKRSAA